MVIYVYSYFLKGEKETYKSKKSKNKYKKKMLHMYMKNILNAIFICTVSYKNMYVQDAPVLNHQLSVSCFDSPQEI
jgi:hypothetical protein